MAVRPPLIYRPAKTPALQVLILSEGYTDEAEFRGHIDGIFHALMAIQPFSQVRARVAAWASFVASNDDGVTDQERDTPFALHIAADGLLTTARPQRIIDQILQTQVSIPHLDDPLEYVDGAEVWLGRLVPEESLVCILAKSSEASSTTIFHWPANLAEPATPSTEIDDVLPCIFLSAWPLTPGSQPTYPNPQEAAALVLAKQIGRFMGLADESERAGAGYLSYAETDPFDPTVIREPEAPNITALATLLDENGMLDVGRLKWRALIPAHKLTGIAESPHPIASPGASEAAIRQMYEQVADLADASILLVRHPGHVDVAREGPNLERYVEGTSEPLRLAGEVNLFEGAGMYRQGLYRPASECLMRFEGYDRQVGGSTRREAVDYCPVCFEHIQRQLNGLAEFQLDGVEIHVSQGNCRRRRESRLAELIMDVITQTGTQSEFTDGLMYCVECTAKRLQLAFEQRLKWSLNHRVPAGDWNPPWIMLPMRSGARTGQDRARRAWAIWNTKLKPTGQTGFTDPFALPNWVSRNWAGLGAAGAIVYLGFGCLVNARRPAQMVRNGVTIRYLDVDPLTVADFGRIEPGSLLQIWRGDTMTEAQDNFRDIIAYVEQSRMRRQAGLQPEPPPAVAGHSLYFVGMQNNTPMVADQTGISKPLTSGWREDYRFWIAAQWFDASGFTLL